MQCSHTRTSTHRHTCPHTQTLTCVHIHAMLTHAHVHTRTHAHTQTLTCIHIHVMLTHAHVHGGCADPSRESLLRGPLSEAAPGPALQPLSSESASVPHLEFLTPHILVVGTPRGLQQLASGSCDLTPAERVTSTPRWAPRADGSSSSPSPSSLQPMLIIHEACSSRRVIINLCRDRNRFQHKLLHRIQLFSDCCWLQSTIPKFTAGCASLRLPLPSSQEEETQVRPPPLRPAQVPQTWHGVPAPPRNCCVTHDVHPTSLSSSFLVYKVEE